MPPRSAKPPRVPDFALALDEIRAVTAFNVGCVEQVIAVFDEVAPSDVRPQEALAAAKAFAGGGPRSKVLRVAAPAAHRAAKEVEPPASYAAFAAGDAAASAFLHPLADATQVGHILRGPAYCVLALEQRPASPLSSGDAVDAVLDGAGRDVIDVLVRYPRARPGRQKVGAVMAALDSRLRAGSAQGAQGAP